MCFQEEIENLVFVNSTDVFKYKQVKLSAREVKG